MKALIYDIGAVVCIMIMFFALFMEDGYTIPLLWLIIGLICSGTAEVLRK